jgi:hypothetical protein
MAEKKQTGDDEFEINPDGADLDGTAEIERQHAEKTGPKGSPEPPVPASDTRGESETVK